MTFSGQSWAQGADGIVSVLPPPCCTLPKLLDPVAGLKVEILGHESGAYQRLKIRPGFCLGVVEM